MYRDTVANRSSHDTPATRVSHHVKALVRIGRVVVEGQLEESQNHRIRYTRLGVPKRVGADFT